MSRTPEDDVDESGALAALVTLALFALCVIGLIAYST